MFRTNNHVVCHNLVMFHIHLWEGVAFISQLLLLLVHMNKDI